MFGSWKENHEKPRQHIKKQRHYFAKKGLYSQSYDFSSSRVVGKTTRPFRYDINQIPYDYTVEVRNRFKGLDLIDRVPDELWMELRDIVQETGIKTISV